MRVMSVTDIWFQKDIKTVTIKTVPLPKHKIPNAVQSLHYVVTAA